MKRFHVHVAVADLPANIEFYSKLFGRPPAKQRCNYAKWMLDDPRVNFAISVQQGPAGIDHLGMQAELPEELATLRSQAELAARGPVLDEGQAACCYARSEKHWTRDPQGIAWEHFLTAADAEEFRGPVAGAAVECCEPLHAKAADAEAPCCVPAEAADGIERCCA